MASHVITNEAYDAPFTRLTQECVRQKVSGFYQGKSSKAQDGSATQRGRMRHRATQGGRRIVEGERQDGRSPALAKCWD